MNNSVASNNLLRAEGLRIQRERRERAAIAAERAAKAQAFVKAGDTVEWVDAGIHRWSLVAHVNGDVVTIVLVDYAHRVTLRDIARNMIAA